MTFHSNKPESLRNVDRLTRDVYCVLDKTVFKVINLPEPKCPLCGNIMVNIIKSPLTGKLSSDN